MQEMTANDPQKQASKQSWFSYHVIGEIPFW